MTSHLLKLSDYESTGLFQVTSNLYSTSFQKNDICKVLLLVPCLGNVSAFNLRLHVCY